MEAFVWLHTWVIEQTTDKKFPVRAEMPNPECTLCNPARSEQGTRGMDS